MFKNILWGGLVAAVVAPVYWAGIVLTTQTPIKYQKPAVWAVRSSYDLTTQAVQPAYNTLGRTVTTEQLQ